MARSQNPPPASASRTRSAKESRTLPNEALYKKIALRLIPFMMVLYLVAFLDRVNISFAALTMNADLGFSPTIYGWGAGIFFLGYFIVEAPSNLILERVGARLWICRIMSSAGRSS